ncbi:MAG: hypothetical protein ABJD97_01680 [Betaproteobacteria bacterium]
MVFDRGPQLVPMQVLESTDLMAATNLPMSGELPKRGMKRP